MDFYTKITEMIRNIKISSISTIKANYGERCISVQNDTIMPAEIPQVLRDIGVNLERDDLHITNGVLHAYHVMSNIENAMKSKLRDSIGNELHTQLDWYFQHNDEAKNLNVLYLLCKLVHESKMDYVAVTINHIAPPRKKVTNGKNRNK